MIRFRWYYNKDAEQLWLNDLCKKGWAFENFFLGFYTFKACKPEEYIYQIDLLESNADSRANYKEFMEENQIEVVSQWYRWIYLRKEAVNGPFELYTDNGSLIQNYTRIRNFFTLGTIIELTCSLQVILSLSYHDKQDIFNICISILLLCIIFVFLRMVWTCQRKINMLKKQ